jgi:predicted transcriptional regulator
MKPKEEEEIISSINKSLQNIKDQINKLGESELELEFKEKISLTKPQIQLIKPPVAQIFLGLAKRKKGT